MGAPFLVEEMECKFSCAEEKSGGEKRVLNCDL